MTEPHPSPASRVATDPQETSPVAPLHDARFLEDRDGHLWLIRGDVLIEWTPWSRDYVERTRGPLTEWSDPSA